MKMNDKVYDVLKEIAQIWLPAIATLYSTLALIWGLPYAEQIVGSIVAIDTFLGAILKISTVKYNAITKDEEYKVVAEQQAERIKNGEFDGVDYSEEE